MNAASGTQSDRMAQRRPDEPTGAVVATAYSFWYGAKQALHDISLEVPARSVLALIGPSGCGKSTFLRSINRMNDLIPGIRHEGEIRLDGVNIVGTGMDTVALRQRVGMVFQRWNPFPKSIYDNIAYGPRINGQRNGPDLDEIVESSLRRAALWDEVKDRLRQSALGLSGGSSNGCASRGHWPTSRKSCSWTNRRAPSTPSPRSGSRSYYSN